MYLEEHLIWRNEMNMTNRNPRVGLGVGITLNTGNYQSIKIYISQEIDCLDDDPEEVLEYLQGSIMQQLLAKKQDIKDELGV